MNRRDLLKCSAFMAIAPPNSWLHFQFDKPQKTTPDVKVLPCEPDGMLNFIDSVENTSQLPKEASHGTACYVEQDENAYVAIYGEGWVTWCSPS